MDTSTSSAAYAIDATFPMDAAFALTTASGCMALAVSWDNRGLSPKFHNVEVAALGPAAAAAEEEWRKAETAAPVVGAAPFRTDAARCTWVVVPSVDAKLFVRNPLHYQGQTLEGRFHLWNPATDTILIMDEGVLCFGPASRAIALPGRWMWRPLPTGDGRAGQLQYAGDDLYPPSALACREEGDGRRSWRLLALSGSEYAENDGSTHLVCRPRKRMGTCCAPWFFVCDSPTARKCPFPLSCGAFLRPLPPRPPPGYDIAAAPSSPSFFDDSLSPPFKLVSAASLRALCACSGNGIVPRVCRQHLSDDRRWAYHARTQVKKGLFVDLIGPSIH